MGDLVEHIRQCPLCLRLKCLVNVWPRYRSLTVRKAKGFPALSVWLLAVLTTSSHFTELLKPSIRALPGGPINNGLATWVVCLEWMLQSGSSKKANTVRATAGGKSAAADDYFNMQWRTKLNGRNPANVCSFIYGAGCVCVWFACWKGLCGWCHSPLLVSILVHSCSDLRASALTPCKALLGIQIASLELSFLSHFFIFPDSPSHQDSEHIGPNSHSLSKCGIPVNNVFAVVYLFSDFLAIE